MGDILCLHTQSRGPRGRPGERGKRGHTGQKGPQGVDGGIGAQGFQGVVFENGPQGNVGMQGQQGFTSESVGEKGFDGLQGPQSLFLGPQGFQGAGTDSARGSQGFQGFEGFQSHTEQGLTGPQGSDGFQGAQGASGMQGVNGTQGLLGDDGDLGPQGPVGYQGIVNTTPGLSGTQGYLGDAGLASTVRGASGPQGFVGVRSQPEVGPQGEVFRGPQGSVGYAGPLGSQGYEGPRGSSPFAMATLQNVVHSNIQLIGAQAGQLLDSTLTLGVPTTANGKAWVYFSASFTLSMPPDGTAPPPNSIVKIEVVHTVTGVVQAVLDITQIESSSADYAHNVFMSGFIPITYGNDAVGLRVMSETTSLDFGFVPASFELTVVGRAA